jgi:hypothetical protein
VSGLRFYKQDKLVDRLGHPVPGGYKYGNLALKVGGVSDETVKFQGESKIGRGSQMGA